MSRRIREQAILDLVSEHEVENQRQLIVLLRSRGLVVTQATVSRDLRRLGLVKRPAASGGYRYSSPHSLPADAVGDEHQLRAACEQFLTRIDQGEALLVLNTLSGRANALAVAIDECRIPEIAGTIAGDDTILVVTRRIEDREKVRRLLEGMVG